MGISLRGTDANGPATWLTDDVQRAVYGAGYQHPVIVDASRSTACRVFSVDGTWLSRNENSLILPSAPRAKPLWAMSQLSDPVLASISPAAQLLGAVT
jgi:hypothetical protein